MVPRWLGNTLLAVVFIGGIYFVVSWVGLLFDLGEATDPLPSDNAIYALLRTHRESFATMKQILLPLCVHGGSIREGDAWGPPDGVPVERSDGEYDKQGYRVGLNDVLSRDDHQAVQRCMAAAGIREVGLRTTRDGGGELVFTLWKRWPFQDTKLIHFFENLPIVEWDVESEAPQELVQTEMQETLGDGWFLFHYR